MTTWEMLLLAILKMMMVTHVNFENAKADVQVDDDKVDDSNESLPEDNKMDDKVDEEENEKTEKDEELVKSLRRMLTKRLINGKIDVTLIPHPYVITQVPSMAKFRVEKKKRRKKEARAVTTKVQAY
jgi:hypothetical protein